MQEDPSDITAWQRLDTRTTTSGKLRATDIARLAALGVHHVINLAPDDRPGALEGEAALLGAAGLRYTHIPVPFDAPTDAHYEAFARAMDADGVPVHVHCIANWRVSAFFCRYNRDVRGMAEEDARSIMREQWDPDRHDHPDAPAWADFLDRG